MRRKELDPRIAADRCVIRLPLIMACTSFTRSTPGEFGGHVISPCTAIPRRGKAGDVKVAHAAPDV